MVFVYRRFIKIIQWSLVALLMLMAVLTVAMRILLPHLTSTKLQLQQWVQQKSGFEVDFSSISGNWRYLVPSLSLENISLKTKENHTILKAKQIEFELNIWDSLVTQQLSFSHVNIEGLNFNVTELPKSKNETPLIEQLEELFLVKLGEFSVRDSNITVLTPADELKTIAIHSLYWSNRFGNHHVQALVSIAGTSLNQVDVRGVFQESHGLDSVSGEFYLQAQDVSLITWIKPYLNPNIALKKAKVGGQLWLVLEQGVLSNAQLELNPSQLVWASLTPSLQNIHWDQSVKISKGQVNLQHQENGSWRVATTGLQIKTGSQLWQDPNIQALIAPSHWLVNVGVLDLDLLTPLRELISLDPAIDNALNQLNLKGMVSDIRIEKPQKDPIRYSAEFEYIGFNHWTYLPEIEDKLHAFVRGVGLEGQVGLKLQNANLPYGDFFQAPLQITDSYVMGYWRKNEQGLQIWSDHVQVQSPDLSVVGQFLLDIPTNASPWLSFYAEAKLQDAGQAWRYLPTLALGHKLTDYLSAAIGAGEVEAAKLLWYGDFATFPYAGHQGIFQASVPIAKAKFSFASDWPALTAPHLNLLFQNDALFFDSPAVDLMQAKGYQLKGVIPSFSEKISRLKIDANIESSGDALRNYMLATPLVDSVGAALNHIQVGGDIKGDIKLNIPLNGDPVDAKGKVALKGNKVHIVKPAMNFAAVDGNIDFHNDEIRGEGFSALLLEQAVTFNFQAQTEGKDYLVNLAMQGDWQDKPLKAALGWKNIGLVAGQSRWDLALGVALQDTGFNYDVTLDAKLDQIKNQLPAPFNQVKLKNAHAKLKASGDQQQLIANIELPNLLFQADIDISQPTPEINRSQLIVGKGELSLMPLSGNVIQANVNAINVVRWGEIFDLIMQSEQKSAASIKWPMPTRLNIKAGKIITKDLTFNKASIAMRSKKNKKINVVVGSEEVAGEAVWDTAKNNLRVDIEHLFLNFPASDDKKAAPAKPKQNKGQALAQDRLIMANMPSTELKINELWVQGYHLGKLDAVWNKQAQTLSLNKLFVGTKDTYMTGKGKWDINAKGISDSQFSFYIQGADSGELMGRFAVMDGIQDASFVTQGQVGFKGSPWALDLASLTGSLKTTIEKGYISGVGGAGRLLGLFSIDSILRKIKLDFTGIFEQGLAFDQITGNATIEQGVVTTNDLKMKALAGDMYLNGYVDLANNKIDAKVKFIPDLTSGLPVLTAFAIAPPTALYVLAFATVMSPVIDAITQINYEVTGPLDAPVVTELSRKQAEVKLSEKEAERLRALKDKKMP